MAGVSLKRVLVGTLTGIGGLFVLLVIVALAKQHDPYVPPVAQPVSPDVAAATVAKQRELEAKKSAAAAEAAAAKKAVAEKQRQERRDFAERINKTTSFAAKTGGGDDRALIILVDHCTEANLAAMVRAMTAARLREVGFYFVKCTDPGEETHTREL